MNTSGAKPITEANPAAVPVKAKGISTSSRSAKLRFAFKVNEKRNFTDFIDKFQFYLDIEKLKEKI